MATFCLFVYYCFTFHITESFSKDALPTSLQQLALQRPFHGVSRHPLPSSGLVLPIVNKYLFVLNPLSQGLLQEDP